jgi:transposase
MFPMLNTPPAGFNLRLDDFLLTPSTAVALITSTATDAACPTCGTPSRRVHSRYRRTVADLPCHNRPLVLRLVVRRFRCVHPDCPRGIFCERLPGLLATHARSTDRLADAHRDIGFALGGEAGARLAGRLDMPTSPDTLLRRVKDAPDEPAPPPRFIGVDDWAIRKGQRYGTILIDLERGRVIDLLPGRDGGALKVWLREHPGVEVVSRDRWAAYAQAVSEAAPQARQVADRWHLLKNLREAVERLLGRMTTEVHEALQDAPPIGEPSHTAEAVTAAAAGAGSVTSLTPVPDAAVISAPSATPMTEGAIEPSPSTATTGSDPRQPSSSPRRRACQGRQRQRAERYRRVHELRGQGQALRQIARTTGLSVKSVRRYLRRKRCPDWNPGRRAPTQLDGSLPFIEDWLSAGGRNAAQLHRELAGRGCRASYESVRRYLARRLGSTGRPGPRVGPVQPPTPPPPPSARKLSFEFIRRPEDRTAEEQGHVDRLRAGDSGLRAGLDLAAEFAALVRKAGTMPFADWLTKAAGSGCAEVRSFAASLRQDEAAVAAALTEPWSNGPVEGHVNRLKVIKRQMYGRAGLHLLRARVRKAG